MEQRLISGGKDYSEFIKGIKRKDLKVLIFLLINSDNYSFRGVSRKEVGGLLGINNLTVSRIFDVLINSNILVMVGYKNYKFNDKFINWLNLIKVI